MSAKIHCVLPAAFALIAVPLQSQAAPSKYRMNWAVDGSATGLTFVGGALFALIPVDTESQWESELLPFDEMVKKNFSSRSAAVSDALVLTTIVTPLAAQIAGGMNEELGRTALIYGEALGGSFLLNSGIKYLVQRPRPYTYNDNADVQTYAKAQGKDSRLSFYSGHSTMAFTAAVAGSYLYALSSTDSKARATLWGVELALATATANLRVRAGKHFYSDVILGAVLGSAMGFLAPYLHQRKSIDYSPELEEWAAMGGGILVGALASQALPLKSDVTLLLDGGSPRSQSRVRFNLAPMAVENGAGLMVAGLF